MLPLRDVQHAFSRAVLGGPETAILAALAADRLAPAQRLQIYRNHVRITLRHALAASFPVVERLAGAGWFATVARDFVVQRPPRSPVLAEYGADFPAHLETARNAPAYLADVARLEWALACADRAPEADALAPAMLARLPAAAQAALRLAPMPATALLRSAYPILAIWRANQPDVAADAMVDLAQGGETVLVWRDAEGDPACRVLAEAEAAFVGAVIGGLSLGEAAGGALVADAGFDLVAAIAGLLAQPILRLPSGRLP
jgi:hypothetical protein